MSLCRSACTPSAPAMFSCVLPERVGAIQFGLDDLLQSLCAVATHEPHGRQGEEVVHDCPRFPGVDAQNASPGVAPIRARPSTRRR